MTRAKYRNGVAAVFAAGMLAAGCGSAPDTPHASTAAGVPAMPLNTSLATAAGTWATVVMGGSAAQHNNFWQLFIRPAGASAWKLVTPPGTADNGGLVLAGGAGQSAITAFRPSQYLTYTPLSQTSDAGRAWSALGPLDTALASTPGSLAVQPGSSRLLALSARGTAEDAAPGASNWTTLTTERILATTPAGQRCGLRALTSAAYTPSGVPLLAGSCSHRGVAGIFAEQNGTWQAVGPALPSAVSGQDITVLRLANVGSQTIALMQVGSGRTAGLVAAWSVRQGSWTVSAPLERGGPLISASFGPAGTAAVITASGTAAVITNAVGAWHALPAPPPGTATLAPGTGGQADALAAHAGTLTVWHLPAGGAAWTRAQVISVPIQYGSSG